jgi:hypothetical protein
MTATGTFPQDDAVMTEFLDNTLSRGTRWGWDFVNAENQHAANAFDLYDQDWTSKTLDIIEGGNWPKWLKKSVRRRSCRARGIPSERQGIRDLSDRHLHSQERSNAT